MRLVVAVLGTRPEAIKFAPVLAAFAAQEALRCETIVTGQQADLLREQLAALAITVHHRLEVMQPGQSVTALLATTARALMPLLAHLAPRAVLVQGDTTTALAAALVASALQIPVVHIEAGLRSFNFASPYPEEANRVLISHASSLHCAATADNVVNLVNEGIAPEAVVLTGNPIVDALQRALPAAQASPPLAAVLARHAGRHVLCLTVHRRENFGARLIGYVGAVRDFVAAREDVALVAPVHPNPEVRHVLHALLDGQPRVELTAPLGYQDFLALLAASSLVLSDSGGVQEEVAAIGVPLLVLRDCTERREILASGLAQLVPDPPALVAWLAALEHWPTRQALAANPFGDGKSGPRIVRAVARLLSV
ncbi:MAG: UDP-N-acetylglucosamine 2-epimerase (non-hydrolyzing) [Gammaproteobacteria bacterium]|nr:UDP-N-acetylglucosamine 2-epimerase (non-hydrolyzing) [Gammaproteobacteria bacterium]